MEARYSRITRSCPGEYRLLLMSGPVHANRGRIVALVGKFHRQVQYRQCEVRMHCFRPCLYTLIDHRYFRIAGLDKDTHLHGNQFNTALASQSSLPFKLATLTYSISIYHSFLSSVSLHTVPALSFPDGFRRLSHLIGTFSLNSVRHLSRIQKFSHIY